MNRFSIIIVLGGLIVATSLYAMGDSESAYVGDGSRSSGASSVAPAVERAYERAMESALESGVGRMTTEHVLIELLDDESVQEVLTTADADRDSLRVQLLNHLEANKLEGSTYTQMQVDSALQSAMQRAVMKTFLSNRKGASGADILTAILVENNSVGARILRDHGLTIDVAENKALEIYLARSAEQGKKLEALLKKIEAQRPTSSETDSFRVATKPSLQGAKPYTQHSNTDSSHKAYKLRVIAETGESNIGFKAAVSHNGQLDLYVEETPFEIEFVAATIVALFEAVEASGRIKVELITDIEGQQRTVSGFAGSSGAIFQDRNISMKQRSGHFTRD